MFGGEASDKKVKVLSGGERTRLAMIKLLLEPVNLLILDEPTNHLDLRSKDVLKSAIRNFDGTVIIVSHDREFLDGLVEKVYEFGEGKVREHLGGIYDFLKKKQIESLAQLNTSPTLSTSKNSTNSNEKSNSKVLEKAPEKKLSYEEQKERSKRVRKIEKQVADSEKSIETLEAAIAILEAQMATQKGSSDTKLYERHQNIKAQLNKVVEEWEATSLELEKVKKD